MLQTGHADWLTWPGWAFVGTCAEVAALLTFAIAAYGWWRSRRRYPPINFEIRAAYKIVTDSGRPLYRARVTNIGHSTAHIRSIYFLGAVVADFDPAHQIEWLVKSAESFEFDLESSNIQIAWMLIIAGSFEDNRLLRAAWYPLGAGTELALKHQHGYVRTRIRSGPWGWRQRRHPGTVGPENDAVAFIMMPKRKLQDIPPSVIAEVSTYDWGELRRPGTSQTGKPSEWVRLP
jgi:hypothetical protein